MHFVKFFYQVSFVLLAICSTGCAEMSLLLVNKLHQTLIVHFGKPLANGSTSRLVLPGLEPAESTVIVGKDWKDNQVEVQWALLGDMDTVHFTADNQQCVSASNDKTNDGAVDVLEGTASAEAGMSLSLVNKSDKYLIAHFSKPLADGTTSRLIMAGTQEQVIVGRDWKDNHVKIAWEAPIDTDRLLFIRDDQHLISTSDDKTNNGPVDSLK